MQVGNNVNYCGGSCDNYMFVYVNYKLVNWCMHTCIKLILCVCLHYNF